MKLCNNNGLSTYFLVYFSTFVLYQTSLLDDSSQIGWAKCAKSAVCYLCDIPRDFREGKTKTENVRIDSTTNSSKFDDLSVQEIYWYCYLEC